MTDAIARRRMRSTVWSRRTSEGRRTDVRRPCHSNPACCYGRGWAVRGSAVRLGELELDGDDADGADDEDPVVTLDGSRDGEGGTVPDSDGW